MKEYQWGIMGAGGILRRWIRSARQAEGCSLAAVASRTMEHAEKAAAELDIPVATDYESLVKDPNIDICYVAVPHPFHRELAELAMNHGKHVLVEKPATVTAADWQAMCDCARRNGVFLMEAMWTRLFPAMDAIRALFTPEDLGPLKAISCLCGSALPDGARGHRNLNPALAGGGLLDMGVYCLHLSDALYDAAPEALSGYASINSDDNQFGVDEQAMFVAKYPGQKLASMGCAVRTAMGNTAMLYGTSGTVEMPRFWCPTKLIVRRAKGWNAEETEVLEFPAPQVEGMPPQEGFAYEILHTQECVAQGLQESPVIPWAATARVMEACDALRAQWGLKYPFEA